VASGPAAFLTYARFNDQHDDGLISAFRDRLAAEAGAQTGAEFAIFQDRNDIAWARAGRSASTREPVSRRCRTPG
jgi:F-box protein 11